MEQYINQEGSSNKFWGYTINGQNITFKWGRIGGHTETLTERYDSKKLSKKISSKLKKGYVKVTDETLQKEKQLASALGTRTKVASITFVSVDQINGSFKTHELDEFDPNKHILVHLIDSWSKNEIWYLLTASKFGKAVMKTVDNTFKYAYDIPSGDNDAILTYIQDLIDKATTIITAAFGSMGGLGVRSLDGEAYDSTYQSVITQIKNQSNESDDVIAKIAAIGFANLGIRTLD